MFEVHYKKWGVHHKCECANYVQAFNFISCIRNRVARGYLMATTIELYNPDGHLSYQLIA